MWICLYGLLSDPDLYTNSRFSNFLVSKGKSENWWILKSSVGKTPQIWNFPIYPAKVHCYIMLKTNKTISQSKFRSIPFCAQN